VPIFVTRQVHHLYSRLLQDAEVGLPEILEFDAIHGIKTLVLSGRGVTLTPVGLFSSDIAAGALGVAKATGLGISRSLVIAWSSVRPHPRALEAVSSALAEEVIGLANLGVFAIPDSAPTIALPTKSD
jgi:DNA-binding transcriptional LysR family regulator